MSGGNNDIGVIGLGAMGRGMAASLRRAGLPLRVFDMRADAVADFVREGGTGCS
ncbi:MAG: NAD(P)-binding domain-containing protein, partial [Rubrivivax sp.]